MTDVPSNLIPTRITELPEYSGASADGYMPYVYGDRTYKAQLSYLMNGTLSSAIVIGTTGNATGVRLLRGQTAIEQDAAGTFYLTQGLSAGTLSRRVILAEASPTVVSATSPGGTVTYVSGAGFARVVLTVGGAGIAPGTFLTLTFDNLPANAVVVGSRDTAGGNLDGGHEFSFFAKSGNRIQIALLSGTLLASGVYNFSVMWRIP